MKNITRQRHKQRTFTDIGLPLSFKSQKKLGFITNVLVENWQYATLQNMKWTF